MKKVKSNETEIQISRIGKNEPSRIAFNVIAYGVLFLFSVACIVPFLMIVSGSVSSNSAIIRDGYSILPRGFDLSAYKMIFSNPDVIGRAYGVTIFVTVVGTVGGLAIMSMAGYALQRSELKYSGAISFFFYFSTLFSCGMVPSYMLISNLGMRNSLAALIVPMMVSPFNILLVRNFMKSIPASLVESAKIDGAGDFLIYCKVILPLAKPIMATIGLFLGLAYWNDWYMASLYIKDVEKWPLQYKLYQMLSAQMTIIMAGAEHAGNVALPTESVKLANAVVATGPILLLYPFLQKYFVQGITIGAVKG